MERGCPRVRSSRPATCLLCFAMPLVMYLEDRGNRVWLGIAGLALAVVGILANINMHTPLFPLIYGQLPGLAFLAAGFLAWGWGRRRTAVFLLLVGFTWFIGSLEGLRVPLIVALSLWFQDLWRVVLAHTALAYPEGELRQGLSRAVVLFGYGFIVAGGLIRTMAANGDEYYTCECPKNALGFIHNKAFFEAVDNVYGLIGALIELILIVVLVRLYSQSRADERPLHRPLLITAVAFAIVLVVEVLARAIEVSPPMFEWLYFVVHLGFVGAAASYVLALRRDPAAVSAPSAAAARSSY
jgi:hypothetical protein